MKNNKPRLAIVSDTSMWDHPEKGRIAFEPVVKEIETFQHLFSTMEWLGYRRNNQNTEKNARLAKVDSLRYAYLPEMGGKTIFSKLHILILIPLMALKVLRVVLKSDVVHMRGPSHPALIALIISFFDWSNRIYWFKYAGNWIESSPPFFYKIQRGLLKIKWRSNLKTTINGNWEDGKKVFLNFKNPCVSEETYLAWGTDFERKEYLNSLNVVFVGRLVEKKGILNLLEAVKEIGIDFTLHVVGDGPLMDNVEAATSELPGVKLYGFLDAAGVTEIYKNSHLLILPSETEGFPKVIAEGAQYGVVPIVTDISSIGQIVKDDFNGFLMVDGSVSSIKACLNRALKHRDLKGMAQKCRELARGFTYQEYVRRIQNEILA